VRQSEWKTYLDWASRLPSAAVSGVRDGTRPHPILYWHSHDILTRSARWAASDFNEDVSLEMRSCSTPSKTTAIRTRSAPAVPSLDIPFDADVPKIGR